MARVAQVNTSGNADIDGVLAGVRWEASALTWSAPVSNATYNYGKGGFEAFTTAQIDAAALALKNFSSFTSLQFTQVSESASSQAVLRFGEADDAVTGYAYYPSESDSGGDVFFNHVHYEKPVVGSYAYAVLVHEIGHALGLDHGHEGLAVLPFEHDSIEYSAMTYRSHVGADVTGYTVAEGSYPSSIMLADIAALQYLYGANYSYNAGDTTYRWDPNSGERFVDGASHGSSAANKVFETIWDGGGTDTYDFSNYKDAVQVDLRPGEWTVTSNAQLADLGNGHHARGNIANAWLHEGNAAAIIENALGGGGNDVIFGNVANNTLDGGAGKDRLYGHEGDDHLTGRAGHDKLDGGVGRDYLDGGEGNDSLKGGSGKDKLIGGEGDDTLKGGSGKDKLKGGAGNDTLDGGARNDTLDGGKGNDTLIGGAGADSFVFSEAPKSGNVDTIVDFSSEDVLVLDHSVFTALATGTLGPGQFAHLGTAEAALAKIVYDGKTGGLYYDADGQGHGGDVLIANLQKGLSLSADDFIVK